MDQNMADGASDDQPHAQPMECDRETAAVIKVQKSAGRHLAQQREIKNPVESDIDGSVARLTASQQAGKADPVKSDTSCQPGQRDINRIRECDRDKPDRTLHMSGPHQLARQNGIKSVDPRAVRRLGRDPQSGEDRDR